MILDLIFKDTTFECNKNFSEVKNIDISDICYNSSKCNSSSIFIALKGQTVDGHLFVKKAYDKGCRVFVLENEVELPNDCIRFIVENTRKILAKISSNFFNNPSSKLTIIGVTGTKGKTTITNHISSVLNASGINTGVIGTNGTFYNGVFEKTINTTPESYELQRIFRTMLDNGVKCVAMEVSSGGLMMNRVDCIDFDIALFSNISPDHIGPKEHPTFENYLDCKTKLFKMAKYGIINNDADFAQYVIDNASCKTTTFSIYNDSDIKATNIKYSNSLMELGSSFDYPLGDKTHNCYICSPGDFSIYNALSVIAVCSYLGINIDTMTKALATTNVEGRVQVLPVLPYATVIIDYAHNGVSLENILTTLKKYNPSRLICLFGSIGGRSELRRKELGDIAAKYCDLSILTSDNPDFEDPNKIIADIEESFINAKNPRYITEPDRELAIKKAIQIAQKGDIILFAGKGHEKYQLIEGEHIPFDEALIAKEEANKLLTFRELNKLSV